MARQLQSAMVYKQMHKADAHWLTGISDENKHNITFSIIIIHFYVYLTPSYATPYRFLVHLVTNLLFAYPLKYCIL